MKDFFIVLGKAFAVVFGTGSALALVLVLAALAPCSLLRPQPQLQRPSEAFHTTPPSIAGFPSRGWVDDALRDAQDASERERGRDLKNRVSITSAS